MTHKEIMEAVSAMDQDQLMSAIEGSMMDLSNPGICLKCGDEYGDCEPDLENRECESCGEHAVFGIEQLLFYMS